MRILNVVGTRPNFIKMAPLLREQRKHKAIESLLVHTGQHYDHKMSETFMEDLGVKKPDWNFKMGSLSPALQVGSIIIEMEKVIQESHPDIVLVVGDVNSTLAASIAAKKCGILVAHIEAGLRSRDREMPEELNRIATDAISDLLFATSHFAVENLLREAIPSDSIFLVGNVMIDSLRYEQSRASSLNTVELLGFKKRGYALVTLHRPSNVDHKESLEGYLRAFQRLSETIPIVFPIHPRTRANIQKFELEHYFHFSSSNNNSKIRGIDPLGYSASLNLMMNAKFVVTDSGGIQEETTALNIPCLTARQGTERPETVVYGTNQIIGTEPEAIWGAAQKILNNDPKQGGLPELWDGEAADRITKILLERVTSAI